MEQPGDAREENRSCRQNDAANFPVLVARLEHMQDAQRLFFCVRLTARVLDNEIRLFALFFEWHLGSNALLGIGFAELVAVHQTRQLDVLFTVGFTGKRGEGDKNLLT